MRTIVVGYDETDANAELVPAVGEPAETIGLFGQSVSEAVPRRAHCDVLIVH